MAEKSGKKKTKKAADDPSVLGSLRSTRPTRLGGDRRARTARTPASAIAAKQAAATKPKPAAKSKAKRVKPSAATTSVKSAKPAAAPPAGWQVPSEPDGRREGGPAELVTTAVQAAGELAQIGLTVTGQLLRRAAGRLPRP